MIEKTKILLRRMMRKWKKTLLTLAGISIGVCSVVVISSMGSLGTRTVSAELQSLGLGGILVSHTDTSQSLSQQEIKLLQKSSSVDYVMPLMIMVSTYCAPAKNQADSALLFGVDEGVGRIVSLRIAEGRNFRTADLTQKATICIIDENLEEKYFGSQSALSQTIQLNINGADVAFTVVGIAESGSGLLQSALGSYIPSFVYLPYSTLQSLTGNVSYQQVVVRLKDQNDLTGGTRLVQMLERFTGNKNAYTVQSLAQQQNSLYHLMDIITGLLTLIGGIALFVACLNIMTTMMVSVRERTREIGIRKSIGASAGAIMFEFLLEAAFISALGSLIGITLGCGTIYILSTVCGFETIISVQSCMWAFVSAIACGSVFGVYPAYKAASLDPILALKTE